MVTADRKVDIVQFSQADKAYFGITVIRKIDHTMYHRQYFRLGIKCP